MMRHITGTIVIHQMLAGALMRPINTFAADEGSNTNLLSARKVVTQVVTFLKNAELPLRRIILVSSLTTKKNDFKKFPIYTHGVMNLGVSVCSCALDSVFLIEKKCRPSGLSRVFLIGEKLKMRYRCA